MKTLFVYSFVNKELIQKLYRQRLRNSLRPLKHERLLKYDELTFWRNPEERSSSAGGFEGRIVVKNVYNRTPA